MPEPADTPHLVLASTSPYRRQLLERLGLRFTTRSPEIDEAALPGETPEHLVRRLSEAKARAVATTGRRELVIGSDQVAVIDDQVLGKPGTHARAVEQLLRASGKRVTFLTGLCLLDAATGGARVAVEPFAVVFRSLSGAMVESYLRREQPYNCAGSFKSEGLGIALFERMEGDDPNALIGLPLIRLIGMLEQEGLPVL